MRNHLEGIVVGKYFEKIMAAISLLFSGIIVSAFLVDEIPRIVWFLFFSLFALGVLSAIDKIGNDTKKMLEPKVKNINGKGG
ncbi:hypothetical protein KSF73_11210 [Burkholderiaceae bacterium DAT-1]|nr:hypothetical protein [Burkholderiaceae bacterium DAT-1]